MRAVVFSIKIVCLRRYWGSRKSQNRMSNDWSLFGYSYTSHTAMPILFADEAPLWLTLVSRISHPAKNQRLGAMPRHRKALVQTVATVVATLFVLLSCRFCPVLLSPLLAPLSPLCLCYFRVATTLLPPLSPLCLCYFRVASAFATPLPPLSWSLRLLPPLCDATTWKPSA